MSKSMNDSMRDDIRRVVEQVQIARGRAAPAAVGDEVRPIGDVPGFTVEDGVDATRRLADIWGCPFGDNLFLAWEGTRPQTVREIVTAMMILQAHGF